MLIVYYCCTCYSTSEKPDGEIDLRQIVSVGLNAKAGKDEFGRFDIDVGDRTYRLKAKSKTEAEGWVSALDSWRDYALLNME